MGPQNETDNQGLKGKGIEQKKLMYIPYDNKHSHKDLIRILSFCKPTHKCVCKLCTTGCQYIYSVPFLPENNGK